MHYLLLVLQGNGRFLGMIRELELDEFSIHLKQGDRLIMFSDGVTDATNWNDDHYSLDRLQALVAKQGHLAAEALTDTIVQEVEMWCAGAPAADDLTLLIMEAIQ